MRGRSRTEFEVSSLYLPSLQDTRNMIKKVEETQVKKEDLFMNLSENLATSCRKINSIAAKIFTTICPEQRKMACIDVPQKSCKTILTD